MGLKTLNRLTFAKRARIALLTSGLAAVAVFTAKTSSAIVVMPVTSLSDNDVNDGVCTLRESIIAANTHASYHGCTFGAGTDTIYLLNGTILLNSTLPSITGAITITGGGHALTTIDAQNSVNVGQWILDSPNAILTDMTLQNFSRGTLYVNSGSATMEHSKIVRSGNSTSQGGCVTVLGNFNLHFSQLESCTGHTGGAIRVSSGAGLFMYTSTILKSQAEHGILTADNNALVTIDNSTIAGNRVGGSLAGGEGALYVLTGSSVYMRDSTIAYNTKATASAPGGVTSIDNVSGTVQVTSSVVFGDQTGANDCMGTVTSNGYNAFSSGRGCTAIGTDLVTTTPDLQPLATGESGAGGFTYNKLPPFVAGVGRTYLPGTSSPLLDWVSSGVCAGRSDQRGIRKDRVSNCDIGAVERAPALLVVGNVTLSAADSALKAGLEAVGFSVTVIKDSTSSAASANNQSVVVISESVGSGSVTTKFKNAVIGVLVLEPALFDDMMMTTTSNQGAVSASQTNVTRGTIASRLGFVGLQSSTTSSRLHAWGTPVAGAVSHSQSNVTSSQKHLFEYYAGSSMVSGFLAPGPRIGMFATEDASSALSATGLRLFKEAVIQTSSF